MPISKVNIHGLDFLRSEHRLTEDGDPIKEPSIPDSPSRSISWAEADGDKLAALAANKPDLEKQFDVIHFLQAHRSAGCLAPSVIYERTGIDLEEDDAVAQMLQHNPKIRVEHVPDPENPSLMIATYAYQAKYKDVRDRTSLLAQINRCKYGVARKDLDDAYDGVEVDLDLLIQAGDVLAIYNTEDKTQVLFPRGESFLVELDGIVSVPQKSTASETKKTSVNERSNQGNNGNSGNSKNGTKQSESVSSTGDIKTLSQENGRAPVYCLEIDVDPRSQIRRGEAVQVGGQWFRVSSAVKEGPLKDQPARAQAPLSVVSLQDLSRRNEQDGYIRPFMEQMLPLDAKLSPTALENLRKARQARERLLKLAHGRSGGVTSQLLGSHAHSSNPITLAASLGMASTGSRKRPHKSSAANQAQDSAQAKAAASDTFLALYSHARRHGCTKDVREMYLATREEIPDSEFELKKLLLEHKLLEPGEEMQRPRQKKTKNLDMDGKPKKKRYYEKKSQRITNTHLEGTEIGAILYRALEKSKQGEQVGDGGM